MYCGSKEPPDGKVMGTPYQCFKRGFGIGYRVSSNKLQGEIEQREDRAKQIGIQQGMFQGILKGSVAERQRKMRPIVDVRLNNLNKDEVRALVQRENQRRGASILPGYSNKSLEQLKQALVDIGYRL